MDKQSLLRLISESGYNVGFGAKKHFATYDIVEKGPGWIGFISIAIGILALVFDQLAGKEVSATLAIVGIAGLYISFYTDKKDCYSEVGNDLTLIFNELKSLYYEVKSSTKTDFSEEQQRLKSIEAPYYTKSLKKQIFLSDWYAHYKFFWQHQIDWISESRTFHFWRDKIPLSAYIFALILLIFLLAWASPYIYNFVINVACR